MISELNSLIALSLIPNLGIKRIQQLLKQLDKPSDLFRFDKSSLLKLDGVGESIAKQISEFNSWDLVESIIDRTTKIDSQLISILDEEYPDSLKQIYDPPVLLWVKGDISTLNLNGIAIVGSRNPSDYALKMTVKFTQDAIQNNLCVYSGLAYGVDTLAHRTSLEMNGKTVAVLGSGIDKIYPNANIPLAAKIVESGGAVISEFLPGTKPDAVNFPIRNRIVSGLSKGVLVIETSEKGGSRITANLALDQNREVFVVPHPLTNPNGTGCNELIKKGYGKLVQDFDDISVELNISESNTNQESSKSNSFNSEKWMNADISNELKMICEVIQNGAHQLDEISSSLSLSSQETLVRLLELEFQDLVSQRSGKYFYLS